MAIPLDTATALSPTRSVVVEACAGSGKTWLLVSRMIRLLLAGAAPSELLAITFTRKAAQEMTDRLHEWLQLLALEDDATVRAFLLERKIPENEIDTLLPRARGLLETVLTATPGPTVTTFHGWFLDLLKRAPLEAGLPWGAPLLEREKLLQGEVRDRLLAQWSAAPTSPEGAALLALLDEIGEHNLRALLNNFIAARAEWWAFTGAQPDDTRPDPVDYALAALRASLPDLPADPESDPLAGFWSDDLVTARVKRVGRALEQGTETERKKGRAIQQALADADIDALRKKILKADGGRLASKATKGLLTALAADADTFLRDYDTLETALEAIAAIQTDQRIWQLNRHGLRLGHAYLLAYQDAKAQQGVIDFADAEWLACRLLQSEEHAPGLALKLDARYRHLLLDEFQDTNPLQWQALSTWLTEARQAEGDSADSAMTVFMVGDPKQAIYRFRRGEARVFTAAATFLETHFNAARFAHNQTRRLAPDVVAALNHVFADEDWFEPHTQAPENAARAGALRCLPVRVEKTDTADSGSLRNPLTTPLPEADDKAVHLEAQIFAHTLRDEVLGRWAVGDGHAARPGDVMALVKKRTHLAIYERELEAVGIPFITSRRGGLLHALEASDLIALLETLLLPHAALKLAHTLKSPVFGCSDDDLLAVFAGDKPRGWERLHLMAQQPDCPATLQRAARLLASWRTHCGVLPVHDLLDRIYFEGDVEARYAVAVPSAMRPQVAANLRAFMQLALTQDGGRYPTLAGFIRELASLTDDADAAPGEGVAADGENAVRLLTIHGAKGLEASIVWLLGGSDHARADSYAVLAPWPPEAPCPAHFSLLGKATDAGSGRAHWLDDEAALAQREADNLLYVALTRAKQGLIVSGDATKNAWVERVAAAWQDASLLTDLPCAARAETVAAAPPPRARMAAPAVGQRLSPQQDNAATRQGELFHACLEAHAPPGNPRNLPQLAARLQLAAVLPQIEIAARTLFGLPALARFFDPAQYRRAHNELTLLDGEGRLQRLDRVVEFDDAVWVIDYKTGDDSRDATDALLRARHAPQLGGYRSLLAALYPGQPVHAALLLADGRLVNMAEM
ncbi:MAG: UvrD-helicase domain-containing protein [Thiobacillus sp.]